MTDKVGRNDPCPYGSGKKHKSCCMKNVSSRGAQSPGPSSFRFEPGSYGGAGSFMPSIACLRESAPDEWNFHFVLVKPTITHDDADLASAAAQTDLEAAFAQREQTGFDLAVAEYLRARGYASVDDYEIAEEDDIGFGR